MTTFMEEQIARLAGSGWARSRSVAAAGLPAITEDYLLTAFPAARWDAAEEAVSALRSHFSGARFADEVTYGVLLVPDPAKLDTRVVPADFVDDRLPPGELGVRAAPWSMIATVTGAYGPAMGSYQDVLDAHATRFTVLGVDTRKLMIRQLWGARVLQCGEQPPDCEHNARWTFTLFPGEPLTEGCAVSGTVLKDKVRFRLGKPSRGIGSARIAPAVEV
ncbi:hypothetical protein NLX83_16540 [Allokutzneria sp. A3M-2-11 16]|uniref:hypothetical protein n=1 Tax=Allokutzneria sp. A3M-2-11 16 TaxID=2962043 RepID=UPI0020B75535|nr:hypothetical protein [Allokutzneria sp. A3M-2-11 16]MCP3800875.1 hypothetical protein [Allokutzneria sp. A3M-2-11 16]